MMKIGTKTITGRISLEQKYYWKDIIGTKTITGRTGTKTITGRIGTKTITGRTSLEVKCTLGAVLLIFVLLFSREYEKLFQKPKTI